MAANIGDINALVVRKIQDKGSFLSGADIDKLIDEAVKEYSRHRPQVVVEDESGDGGFDYRLTGPGAILASWEKGFSDVRKLVYPVDDTSATEAVIDEDAFAVITKVVAGAADDYLRFLSATPSAGETFRVFYTARHVLDATASSLPVADDEAVANLAAAFCLEVIAARYLSARDPSLDADVTDYRSRVDESRRLAEKFRRAFLDHMGIPEAGGPPGAGAIVDTDLGFQWRRPFLFHGKRNR
ncbi:MAG: hypothetical protein ACE5IM_08140 [Nitrospinota bacterium]